MKLVNPLLEYLPPRPGESFFVNRFDFSYFATPWHYHPELELVLIEESSGKRFVGNNITEFSSGDLSFFGQNVPHLYQNPASYYLEKSELRAKSTVLHFLPSALGNDFLKLPEAQKIPQLLEKAKFGMDIFGLAKQQIISKMDLLLGSKGLQRTIYLLEIVNILCETSQYKLICGEQIAGYNHSDSARLHEIVQYIMQNYQREIKLEAAAAIVFMTPTSFCRFFKERTKRTFFEYVKDLRLTQCLNPA